jgi:glycerol-3-phosphate acyltransferase PlsY
VFPACLKFKGGKGVATTLGMLLALSPPVGASCCLIWLAMAIIFRYSSLAALVAIFCAPPAAWFFTHDEMLAGTCSLIAVLVWMKHRANIKRLVSGEEPKIGKKTFSSPTPTSGEGQGETML